jgi:uncharacterized membrane protein YhaH (DUF805 family)
MKPLQERIVSFANRAGKSRWFVVLLVLIAVTYFASFISATIEVIQDPNKLKSLHIFNAAGLLVFSLGASYAAYLLVKFKDVRSRALFLLIFLAAAWGSFSALMRIYPWNSLVAVALIVLGVLISRKYEWSSGGTSSAEGQK